MTTEPAEGADAIDRASAAFWQPGELDSQIRSAEPVTADESFAISDLTEDEWEVFVRAMHE